MYYFFLGCERSVLQLTLLNGLDHFFQHGDRLVLRHIQGRPRPGVVDRFRAWRPRALTVDARVRCRPAGAEWCQRPANSSFARLRLVLHAIHRMFGVYRRWRDCQHLGSEWCTPAYSGCCFCRASITSSNIVIAMLADVRSRGPWLASSEIALRIRLMA